MKERLPRCAEDVSATPRARLGRYAGQQLRKCKRSGVVVGTLGRHFCKAHARERGLCE